MIAHPSRQYKFVASNKNRPCPICGQTSGSCSVGYGLANPNKVQYFCINQNNGENQNYQFLRTTKDGLWGIYREFVNGNQREFRQSKGFGKPPLATIKSATGHQQRKEKDQYFNWLLKKLDLEQSDKDILIQKGLSPKNICNEIFASTNNGILIAFKDVFGYKIGAQIKIRNIENSNGNKYFWHTNSKIDCHLPDGTMPVAVWQDKNSDNSKLCLSEGYLKSYIARCQYLNIGQNHPWIGFGSVSYLNSFNEMERTIKKINPQEIVFYPDSNSAVKKNVANAYLAFWNKLYTTFPNIKLTIASWNHEFSKTTDIDELIEKNEIKYFDYKIYLNYFKGIETYQKENRLLVWKQLTKTHKYILDSSPTGTGKTHDCGQWGSPAIYINTDHRNPSTKTLSNWRDVESRHGGLYRDKAGYVRRISRNETENTENIVALSNCYQHEIHQKLREKGYQSIQICKTCEFLQECQNGMGDGYGYLYQRQNSLMGNQIRIHPDSLPNPGKYDYKNKTIFIEEASDISMVAELKGNIHHLQQYLTEIEELNLDSIEKKRLKTYLEELCKIINNQKGKKYGVVNHLKVPEISSTTQLNLLASGHKTILEINNPNGTENTNSEARKINQQNFLNQIENKINPILSWLLSGYQVWINNNNTFSVYRPKTEIQEIIKSAKNVIFLDATASREKIALMYGLDPQDIHQIAAQKATEPNLEIIQIEDLGKLCQNRGTDQQKRLRALLHTLQANEPDTRIIDLKCYSEDSYWWRDSRGRNQFQGCKQLILVGTPSRNLGQSLCNFLALNGKPHEFQKYYDNQIKADIIQGIGRIRAQQRIETPLKVILITNYKLDIQTQKVKASDITLSAAPKSERTVEKIAHIYKDLQNNNVKPTQKLIAEQLQIARETVNRLWQKVLTILNKIEPTDIVPIETITEEIIQEYADAMYEIYNEFSPNLDKQDTCRLIINTFIQVYQPHKPNIIKNILDKIQEKYGTGLLKMIEFFLNSS